MRFEIVPGTQQRFLCEGVPAYGTVRVRDTQDPAHPEYDARVALTWDGGRQARITVNLANSSSVTENIDDAFLAAYQGLTRLTGGGSPEQRAYCTEMHADTAPVPPAPPPRRETIGLLWQGAPLLGAGLQYSIDRFGLHDLRRIPAPDGFGSLGTAAEIFHIGGQALFVATYIPLHRRADPTQGWITDGLCLGSGLGFSIASAAQPKGEGTPELTMGLTLVSTCGLAMIYGNNDTSRDPARFWTGFGSQLAVGGLFIGLGAGGVGSQPTVSGPDIYAPSTLPPGSRDVPGNPYEAAQFPGIDRDMLILGSVHAGSALFNLANYLWFDGQVPVQVSPMPVRGGGGLSVSGTLP